MKITGTKEYWSMTEGVFNCLIDEKRTNAFARAIKNTIKRDDIVVDMGTGSGILAMLAMKAGAKRVYAIENDKNNIKTLRSTFVSNGFDENSITIIEDDVTRVKIPEKVDVIIGEMIATALIEELQVPAMNNIHKYSKKNVRVLLNSYDTYADLVYNNNLFQGLKFKIIRYEYPDEVSLKSNTFSEQKLLSHVSFTKIIKNNYVNERISFRITKSGIINGIRLSCTTTFFDKSKLKGTFAYSYPIILPINEISVINGEVYDVVIKYKICHGLNSLQYKITSINHAK